MGYKNLENCMGEQHMTPGADWVSKPAWAISNDLFKVTD